jgi:hypothetical protein
MPRKTETGAQYEISARIDGKLRTGTYSESGKMITVRYKGRSKTTQVGGSPVDTIGRMLLRELVEQVSREGD